MGKINWRMSGFGYLGLIICLGCGQEATETAESCVESDLIAQCPPGTVASLQATATSSCTGRANVDVVNEAGMVTGRCESTGSCLVFCELTQPCTQLLRWTREEGIICADDVAECGNLKCEMGELETCASDCIDCLPDETRCLGDVFQRCGPNHAWQVVQDCIAQGQVCRDQKGLVWGNPPDVLIVPVVMGALRATQVWAVPAVIRALQVRQVWAVPAVIRALQVRPVWAVSAATRALQATQV